MTRLMEAIAEPLYAEAVAEAQRLGLMTVGGMATDRCQCTSCGEVFSTGTNFDAHLAPGRQAEGYLGPWCRPPAEVGLVRAEGGWWRAPGPKNRPTSWGRT
jgi:hypothetical protein